MKRLPLRKGGGGVTPDEKQAPDVFSAEDAATVDRAISRELHRLDEYGTLSNPDREYRGKLAGARVRLAAARGDDGSLDQALAMANDHAAEIVRLEAALARLREAVIAYLMAEHETTPEDAAAVWREDAPVVQLSRALVEGERSPGEVVALEVVDVREGEEFKR